VAPDSFPLAARLPFRLGMAAVGAECSGPLVVGVSAAPDSGIGRVMEVRRTLDFCTWKIIFEQKNKTDIFTGLGPKNYHKHIGVTYPYYYRNGTGTVRTYQTQLRKQMFSSSLLYRNAPVIIPANFDSYQRIFSFILKN
jgi:hypothetical protein